jgi:glycosyltransferase involved in cell wall biosynthesis
VRLLFAFPFLPWPPVGGGRARHWYLSSPLAHRHEVHVFALRTPEDVGTVARDLPYASVTVVPVPTASPPRFSPAWAALRVRSLVNPAPAFVRREPLARFGDLVRSVRPDAVVYGMSWLLPYAAQAGGVPGIADEQNYDPLIARRQASQSRGLRALAWRYYAWHAAVAERGNLRRVRAIAACSEEDAAIFRREAPHAEVAVVPNGVDLDAFRPSPPGTAVVMTGSFSYTPNADGARWLARVVWPLVRRAQPAAELRLVGLAGESVLADLAGLPGVTVVGTVPEVQPELARARLAVAPIFVGGGTRLKILEAFAAARPVVSTTVGAEGIAMTDGREGFLRDTPETFAAAVAGLLADAAAAERMGGAGRDLVAARFGWAESANLLDSLIARAVG